MSAAVTGAHLRVLVVDDDEEDYLITRELLSDIESGRFTVDWASTREEALDRMAPLLPTASRYDICLLDYRLGPDSGLDVLRAARERGFGGPVIMLTGQDDRAVDQAALRHGASDYLIKGRIDAPLLERTIRYAVAQRKTEDELRRAAEALAAARQREAEAGAAIQRTLLIPQAPERPLPSLSVGAVSFGSDTIDGDFYDLFVIGERCLDVVVGDVMGKGLAAALLGAAVKSHLQRVQRQLIVESRPYSRLPEPEEIVGGVHALTARELAALNSFVTLDYARFDLATSCLLLVDCGHPGVLHYNAASNSSSFISGENMPLGMCDKELHTAVTVPIADGDVFVFYSDGVTEAEAPLPAHLAGEEEADVFGEERIAELVGEMAGGQEYTAQQMAESICSAVRAFREGKGRYSRPSETAEGEESLPPVTSVGDDLTCVVVRIGAAPVETPSNPDAPVAVSRPLAPVSAAARALRVFEMPGRPAELERARVFVESYCRNEAGLEDEDLDRVIVAVNEALANVVEHAYGDAYDTLTGSTDPSVGPDSNRPPTVQIEAERFGGRLRLRLRDRGAPFDPDKVPLPSFDGSRDQGFGWFIIQQTFDSVIYERDVMGRNVLTLELLLNEAPNPELARVD